MFSANMAGWDRVLDSVLRAASDSNIGFSDLCTLLTAIGFQERVRGDHHVFTKTDVVEIINIQPQGAKAKPYQVKQVRNLIIKYGLGR
jgi:predicted RNA binding protein YcfA (HicA-like mRNA interferase family)